MFTFYHALIFIGAFIFGSVITYPIAKQTGKDEAYREADEYYRNRSQRRN